MGKRWIVVAWVIVALGTAIGQVRDQNFVTIDGLQRRYFVRALRLPEKTKHPVILVLHGAGGTPDNAKWLSIEKYSLPRGFVVAYPEGINKTWNDGRPIEGRTASDVAFLSAVIDEVVVKYGGDPKRINVTGISNGGFMSFTLACQVSEKIAAIATVAASMGVGVMEKCHPAKPVSVMMINGTADPLVTWNGGKVLRRLGSESEPVSKVVGFWRKQVCGRDVRVKHESLPDLDKRDDSTVELERVQCASGEVANYTVTGGGHTWPGGIQYLPKLLVGSVNRDLNASEEIVNFFERH
jgi:polyhydroxybutyrate depolymerase